MQTNFGGVLTIAGAPVGQELGQYYLRKELQEAGGGKDKADGSYMIVVATDAPLDSRNLKRLAVRAAIEATEEAVYNSMLKATTTSSNGHTVEALPIDKTVEILKRHRLIK